MFNNCSSLTYLDLSKATFENLTSDSIIFNGLEHGATIKVKDEAAKTFIQNCLGNISANVEINTTT